MVLREKAMTVFWIGVCVILCTSPVHAQQMADLILQTPAPHGEGWQGFTDGVFLLSALANLVLAAVLGAAIAYHPRHRQTADTLEEIEAAQIYILYAVIGSITGILVVQYGMAVGFVLFGIGALIRFRTVLRSATLTGRLIFVTLIGLSTGLDLPHVAVLVTAFGFVLIYVLDARFTFRISVRALPPESVIDLAVSCREILEQEDCRIISVRKNPDRRRAVFIIRSSQADICKQMEKSFESVIEKPKRGAVDWEVC